MASYHSSFSYNDKNSAKDYGLIITAFEPDNGFVDSFLSMDNISDDYFDGTKRFDYGSRFNTSANIQITAIKKDGSDMTLDEFRCYAKWLTGAKIDSWLDMYDKNYVTDVLSHVGDGVTNEFKTTYPYSVAIVTIDGERVSEYVRNHNTNTLSFVKTPANGSVIEISETPPVYSFLGKFLNMEQYKFDGRTIGFRITFSSVSPWAYSAPQVFDRSIKQSLLIENGILQKDPADEMFVDENGILYPAPGSSFSIDKDGVLYIENNLTAEITNETDDLYNYIYLDIEFDNESCDGLQITNRTLGETTEINNLNHGHIITLSAKQFIAEYSIDQITGQRVNQNRIFGDSFNFVWPRLAPGENELYIQGQGEGVVKFTYRYPMKVGDNTMDISVYGGGASCSDCDVIPSYNTVRWEDIIGTPTTLGGYGLADEVNAKLENLDIEWSNIDNTPATIEGYGITDAYTKSEINSALSNVKVKWENVENTPTTVGGYEISDAYTKSDVYTKTEVDDKIDNIEVSGGGGGSNTTIDEEELNSMLNDILG